MDTSRSELTSTDPPPPLLQGPSPRAAGIRRGLSTAGSGWRSWLDRLWPANPERPAPTGRWTSSTATTAALCVLGLAVSLLRLVRQHVLDMVWAEDGRIFLSQNLASGLKGTLFEPYAGYMHAVPRMLLGIITLLPLRWAAAALTISAAAVVVLLALLVHRALAVQLPSPTVRLLLAAYLVMLPVGREVVDVVANLHWYLLFTAFVVLLWDPRRRGGQVVGGAVLLLTATSDPFGVLLLPLALVRVLALRARRAWTFVIALSVGVAIQAVVMAGSPERVLEPIRSPFRLGVWYLGRVLASTVAGDALTGDDLHVRARAIGLGLVGLVAAAAVAVALRSPAAWRVRPLVVVCAVSSVGLYAVLAGLSGLSTVRYAVPPAMLLVLAVVAAVDGVLDGRPLRSLPFAGLPGVLLTGVCTMVCVAVLTSLPITHGRYAGALWSTEFDAATARCQVHGRPETAIRINPDRWTATLPCSAVAQP